MHIYELSYQSDFLLCECLAGQKRPQPATDNGIRVSIKPDKILTRNFMYKIFVKFVRHKVCITFRQPRTNEKIMMTKKKVFAYSKIFFRRLRR